MDVHQGSLMTEKPAHVRLRETSGNHMLDHRDANTRHFFAKNNLRGKRQLAPLLSLSPQGRAPNF